MNGTNLPASFVVDASLAQEDTPIARGATWFGLLVFSFGVGVHAARRWKGNYTRPYGPTLVALWLAHLLHAASLYASPTTTYAGTDSLIVASWAASIFGDSHWFLAILNRANRRAASTNLTAVALCAGTTTMVLLCEPIRVVHHVLAATLTLCALLVSLTRYTDDVTMTYVRHAATARFACALGWMFCDMPQYVARDVAPLHVFWCVANLVFVVTLLRSYRFRFSNAFDLAKAAQSETAVQTVPLFRVL